MGTNSIKHKRNLNNSGVIILWYLKDIDKEMPNYEKMKKKIPEEVLLHCSTKDKYDEIIGELQKRNNKILLITSGSLGMTLKDTFTHEIFQNIFIYCNRENYHKQWASSINKIKKVSHKYI